VQQQPKPQRPAVRHTAAAMAAAAERGGHKQQQQAGGVAQWTAQQQSSGRAHRSLDAAWAAVSSGQPPPQESAPAGDGPPDSPGSSAVTYGASFLLPSRSTRQIGLVLQGQAQQPAASRSSPASSPRTPPAFGNWGE
jgi:ferric-dicitrate binding protein FerR (iron transport regulator)